MFLIHPADLQHNTQEYGGIARKESADLMEI